MAPLGLEPDPLREASVSARPRRSPRWRRPVVVVLLASLLAGGLVVRDPVLRLGVRSLAAEWGACLLHGEPPGPQPGITAAYDAHVRARRAPRSVPAQDVAIPPLVRPKAQVRTAVSPAADALLPASPRRVVVAVLDSGVASTHRDVDPDHVLPGVDLVNPCGDGRQDVTGHGTAVAGVLLSNHHGAAPRVDVLPIRISLATGRHSSFTSALGIVLAARRGADVINMSYTAQRARPSLAEWLAVRYAHAKGVALVAAAGNDPTRPAGYPAAYPEVLSVTALDGRGELSGHAARTGRIDVAAPGSRVITLDRDGSMRVASGTSLAAPLVSASLVHMLRADPEVTPQQVVTTVRATSEPTAGTGLAHRFGTFNYSAALAGVCAISSACQLTAALHAAPEPGPPAVGDPARLVRPGEPR